MPLTRKNLSDIFPLITLFLSTSAFLSLIVGSQIQVTADGSLATQLVWSAIYLLVLLRLIIRPRQLVSLLQTNLCLISLVLLAMLSAIWSQDQLGTLHKSVALLGTTLFGLDLSARYSLFAQRRLTQIVLAGALILSVFFQVILPGLIPHVDADPSAWQGLFSNKNAFGRIIVLAAIAFLIPENGNGRHRLRNLLIALSASVLIVLSRSMSSLVELVALVGVFYLLPLLRKRLRILVPSAFLLLLIAIPAGYATVNNLGQVTGLLGRDASLTGRTKIWQLVQTSIDRRPLLGFGYDVFWDLTSREAQWVRGEVKWDAANAHNGYMDLLLDVGITGLTLYTGIILFALYRALSLYRNGLSDELTWPILLILATQFLQLTESTIMRPNSIYWILLVSSTAWINLVFRHRVSLVHPRNAFSTARSRPLNLRPAAQPAAVS